MSDRPRFSVVVWDDAGQLTDIFWDEQVKHELYVFMSDLFVVCLASYAPCMVYLPTFGIFVKANVGKYSSTMQHMG